MADEDKDSRTEEATPQRLIKAKEDGEVLQSQEVKMAVQLLAVGIAVWLIVPFVGKKVAKVIEGYYENISQIPADNIYDLIRLAKFLAMEIGQYVAIILFFILAATVTVCVAQVGFRITTKKIAPDINKISPISGFKKMFSLNSLVEFVKNVLKITAVAFLAYLVVRPRLDQLESLVFKGIGASLSFLHDTMVMLLLFIVALVVPIAIVDWIYQRYSYLKRLRMTKQEVKDEYKQMDGDPMVKARLRSIRMNRARQRMMAAVPNADVIVTNPTHYACALKYDIDKMNAPVLVAKGQDFIAKKIREVAEENNVPIVENPPLARAIYASVEIDREIKPEHYKAVAEVISYVMRIKGKKK